MKPSPQNFLQAAMLFALLICTTIIHAQQKTKISGILTDSADGKPVAWATVGIYKAANTQKPLQNLFSNGKGRFEFADLDTGSYVVIVTYTGFREKEFPVKVNAGQSAIEMEHLILIPDPRTLGGVVVSAALRKPLLEQEDEKMIFNAESDPSLEGLTAADVLKKTPFLTVDGEGNVQLNGQSNFKILLNGKETAMFAKNLKDALRSFPASLIKKVEVSTAPSSKYDGEGSGGIINIITQKRVMGYNGNVGVSYNTLNAINANGSFNIKYGKTGLSAYYGVGSNKPPASTSYGEIESLNPVAFYKRISTGSNKGEYNYQYGDMEFAWDVDSLNTVSVYAGLFNNKGNSAGNTQYDMILPNNGGTETSYFKSGGNSNSPSYNVGLDFVHKFRGTEGKEMSVKAYYDNSSDENYSFSEQDNPGTDRFTINNNKAPNRQATIQADLTHPFRNGSKMEVGVKTILRTAESDYLSLIKYDQNDDYLEDVNNSNSFNYRQDVHSVFATYSFKWKQISFKLGGRFEQTHIDGDFTKTATKVKQDYGTFLPNVYMSRKFKKIHTISLSYNKRLRRPYIWDLNPFVSNTDSFNISYGNPQLGPDLIHIVETGYSVFKGNTNINFRLSQSFSNRQILRYTVFDEAKGVAANVTDNAGISRVTGFNVNLSTKLTKKWSVSAGSGIRYTYLKNRFRPEQHNNGWGGYVNLNTNYQITKLWTGYASFYHYRPDVQLQGQGGRYMNYSIGTNYKLFKQKITIGISTANLFQKYLSQRSRFEDNNFIRTNVYTTVQRNINFSLRWNFGKLTENVSRKRGVSNDDIKK